MRRVKAEVEAALAATQFCPRALDAGRRGTGKGSKRQASFREEQSRDGSNERSKVGGNETREENANGATLHLLGRLDAEARKPLGKILLSQLWQDPLDHRQVNLSNQLVNLRDVLLQH